MHSLVIQKLSSLDELVASFNSLRAEIVLAVENENDEQIALLDRELSECWKLLLDTVPENKSDSVELIEFFVDQIIEHPESSQITSASKDRILFLTRRFL